MQTPTLSKVILDAVETRLAGLHTLMPGRVVSVNVAQGKCDVQPLLMRIDANGVAVKLPVISNCPIAFYRAGLAAVYLPLSAGDLVEIRFCERSLDLWLTKGGTLDPEDARKHNLSDAIVYPGLYDFTKPPIAADPDNVVIVNDRAKITLKPSGEIDITNDVGTMRMTASGKYNFIGADAELMETLVDLVQDLIDALTLDPLSGPQPFTPGTIDNFEIIKTKLVGLKA